MKLVVKLLLTLAMGAATGLVHAEDFRMAVTTSFHNSGLSDILLPQIKHDLDLDVRLIVVGTGQALKLGRAGDVDAILVHSKTAEEKFVASAHATHRREIMYNDFVLVGPIDDPANIAVSKSAKDALTAIYEMRSNFVSRGDDSGTHRKERALWQFTGNDPQKFQADWYRAVGSGMGAALNAASGMNAYIISDRASWLKFGNKGNLTLLFAKDPVLFNQYAYLPINPAKHPHVKSKLTKALEIWLTSAKAQAMIGDYKIAGEMLFIPNARPN